MNLTAILSTLGAAAGGFGASMLDAAYSKDPRASHTTYTVAGAAVGAGLGALIGMATTATEKKSPGTVSGAPEAARFP